MLDMNRGHCSRTEIMDHHEVNTAASFVSSLLKMSGGLNERQLQVFQECLQESMSAHYKHHWYPDKPLKGSAYRCIRINNRVAMDPLIAKAANQCGLTIKQLFGLLPLELTLWVDPFHVCYRIGEDGSFCALYEAEATSSLAASPAVPLVDLPCKATSSPASSPVASPILSPVEVTSRPVASPVPLADLPYNKNHFPMSGPSRPLMINGEMYYVPCYLQIPVYYRPSRPCYQIPVYYRPNRPSYQIYMYYRPMQQALLPDFYVQ